jgi:hypothetical protein
MKQITYVDNLYIDRLKIKSIVHNRDDTDIFFIINKGWHWQFAWKGSKLVGHLVGKMWTPCMKRDI